MNHDTEMATELRKRISRRVRAAAGIDQTHTVGGSGRLVLPPEHLLPSYQRAHPLYDRYFLDFFAEIAASIDFDVIDVGANIGDTAVAISAVTRGRPRIVSVEGSRHFLRYLRRNAAAWPNIEIIGSFVEPGVRGEFAYDSDRSTGRLVEAQGLDERQSAWISVPDLLSRVTADTVVWKSDTDGHDASILLSNFDQITERCAIVWVEWDPVSFGTDIGVFRALAERIAVLDRQVVMFDNFGHRIARVECGKVVSLLEQLENWLLLQAEAGDRCVFYLDVWLMPRAFASLLAP